jgi:RNA polymerase sigma-70 factor (ECF subfamily)
MGQRPCDVEAFDALFEAHRAPVHAYLRGRTNHSDQALDLVQETFMRVWRSLDTVRSIPRDEQRYYILVIARRVLNDVRRIERRRGSVQSPMSDPALEVAKVEPLGSLVETATVIDEAISKLPEDMRTALSMSVLGGMESAEIGKVLGRPASTVRYLIYEARRRIAEEVKA